MKAILLAAVAAAATLTAVAPADAAQGCGPGFHRGPRGRCISNRIVGGPRIGSYYAGRGYWDGHRYWQHRERWHNGWRYR